MTPKQVKHLKLVVSYLDKKLAIADKRTPGRWMIGAGRYLIGYDADMIEIAGFAKDDDWEVEQRANKQFIVSCAGDAESGWRIVKKTIDYILHMERNLDRNTVDGQAIYANLQVMAADLLAEFPMSKLQEAA